MNRPTSNDKNQCIHSYTVLFLEAFFIKPIHNSCGYDKQTVKMGTKKKTMLTFIVCSFQTVDLHTKVYSESFKNIVSLMKGTKMCMLTYKFRILIKMWFITFNKALL